MSNGALRAQRSRRRGWRKPEGAVIVCRPSRWGNPFSIADHGRAEAIRLYEEWLVQQPDLMAQLPDLRGKVLLCYCAPDQACHADVLIRLANET